MREPLNLEPGNLLVVPAGENVAPFAGRVTLQWMRFHACSREGRRPAISRIQVVVFLVMTLVVLFGARTILAQEKHMEVLSGFAQVTGGKLYYEMAGQGQTLLFISGGSALDTRGWDDQFHFFPRHFRVVRFDPRGLGKSDAPSSPFSFAEDVRELMDQLQIDKAHIAGLSFAGGVALDFALMHPDRVRSLILVGPAVSGFQYSESFQKQNADLLAVLREKGKDEFVKQLFANPHFFPAPKRPEARLRAAPIISENAARQLTANWSLAKSMVLPAIGRLSEVRAPVLIVVGEQDSLDVLKITEILATEIKGARRVIISDSGHTVIMENPDVFNHIALEFLTSLKKGGK